MRWSCSRSLPVVVSILSTLALGCRRPEPPPTPGQPTVSAPSTESPPPPKPAPRVSEKEAKKEREDLPPERRALMVVDGEERWVDREAIASAGYTLVDLSDGWTPLIFAEDRGPDGDVLANRYRRVFVGLANDRLDSDGEPLPPGEKNYLELYGIAPSISVLRSRFLQDAKEPCHDQESVAVLSAVETVSYVAPNLMRREEARLKRFRKDIDAARKKNRRASLEELTAKNSDLAEKVRIVEKRAA